MESRVAVLETKVETLEQRSVRHEQVDEQLHKYMTRMMEDLQARLAGIEHTGARFEADLAVRQDRESEFHKQLSEIFHRLRMLERMAWIATGGVVSVGGIATFFGWAILKELAR